MKRFLSLVSLVLLSLGLVSCFESKSVITVNKDGSATIEESTFISPQFRARLQAATATDKNASAVLKTLAPDKPGAEERAAKLGEGISLKSLEEVSRPDGFTGVKVTYTVADIRKLRYLLPYNLKESADANARAMTFSLENDSLSVHSPPGGPKSDQPARPPVPKEKVIARVKEMKPLIEGLRLTLEVKSANGLASSDATHVAGDTVTALDVEVDKLLEKPEVLGDLLQDGSSMNQEEIAEKYNRVSGIKAEGKKTFKLVLK